MNMKNKMVMSKLEVESKWMVNTTDNNIYRMNQGSRCNNNNNNILFPITQDSRSPIDIIKPNNNNTLQILTN